MKTEGEWVKGMTLNSIFAGTLRCLSSLILITHFHHWNKKQKEEKIKANI
jgi:hypothetical protein